jgi:hypothetical protein
MMEGRSSMTGEGASMTGNDKLLRVHIQLYESDWNRLLAYYGGQVKRSSVVRELVHNFIQRIDAKAAQQVGAGHTGHTGHPGNQQSFLSNEEDK